MPHVNIWIRKANLEKWEKIPDKSNWVNTLLANSGDTSQYGKVKDFPGVGPSVTVLSEDIKFCKHDAVKGLCKKGCK